MHRFHVLLRAAALVLLGAAFAPRPAAAQNPVPLPTDTNLAATISSTANYLSRSTGVTGSQTMTAWAAAFSPSETFDFSALVGRAFLQLGLPDHPDWGAILICQDDNLSIQVNVTDALSRLGSVAVYDYGSGQLVTTLAASQGGSQCQGSFANDSDVRDYRMVIKSTGGATLAALAVDLGKWDTVAWFTKSGGFEPKCPAPTACSRYTPSTPTDYYRIVGQPISAVGVITYPNTGGNGSAGCATLDIANDSANVVTKSAPPPFETYIKKDVAADTVNFSSFKVGDPTTLTTLSSLVTSLTVKDNTVALGQVTFPPYSTGYGYWRLTFTGNATAVNAVPFEQVRLGGLLGVLTSAINGLLQPANDFLSQLVKAAGNNYLTDQAHRQQTKFKQGAVMALGDVYVVAAQQAVAEPRSLAGILQDVTFTLGPNIAPPAGMNAIGSGSITDWTATTTPPPPAMALNATLSFSPYGAVVTKALPKGYQYKANANITFPVGYQGGTLGFFTVPGQTAVTIPCTLTKLFTWRIVTVTQSPSPLPPGPAHVVVRNAAGHLVTVGDSVLVNGRTVCTLPEIDPGVYTVEATRSMVGAPPATYKGTLTVRVSVGAEAENTVTLTKQ